MNKLKIQTVIFKKRYYSRKEAQEFLKRHGLKSYLDEKVLTYRARQQTPNKKGSRD
jgi:hypothetical protein